MVSMEVPGWEADASGYILSMEAEVAPRRRWQNVVEPPPQLIFHFCRRTISPSTHAAVESAHFTVDQPYQNIFCGYCWDRETWWMISHVAANRVRTADLALLVLAFRRYTRAVLDLFPIMELSTMEFFSVIEIPPTAPSTSTSHLRYFVPPETQQYFFGSYDVDEDEIDEPIGSGPTPAPAAAVEGLRVKIAEEPDVCSICLDEFDITTTTTHTVLEMPCRHIFHDECLREWLTRSNTCPLCRFTLPVDGAAE